MKLNPLKSSLAVSLLFHGVVFGVIGITIPRLEKPALQQDDAPMTLSLIAAPKESAEPAAAVDGIEPVPARPAQTEPEPEPEEIKFMIPPEPLQPEPAPTDPAPLPPVIVSASEPDSTATATGLEIETMVHGDGSSREPGLDATTVTVQAGIKASPNYLKNPEPPYPIAARRRHQQGMVLITVKVTAQGRATGVELKESSGFPLLDEAALNAVRDWDFVPARLDGVAIESEIEVPVRFQLSE